MTKCLVTGASGFIGSNLVETLINKNQQIIGMDKDYKAHIDLKKLYQNILILIIIVVMLFLKTLEWYGMI